MQNYKDLKVWEKAHHFTIQVYRISDAFPKTETYGLTNQLRRASSSIAANIAEGCGKNTKADFANFLNISLGSANEAEYFVLLARDLNYLTVSNYDELTKLVNEIKAMLINLISKVRG
jgi:four helix bundle protein